MHIRTQQAAEAAEQSSPTVAPRTRETRPPTRTLWATRPLEIRGGRAIGIRLCGTELQVVLIDQNSTSLRWLPAIRVLNEAQAKVWARKSQFTKIRW